VVAVVGLTQPYSLCLAVLVEVLVVVLVEVVECWILLRCWHSVVDLAVVVEH